MFLVVRIAGYVGDPQFFELKNRLVYSVGRV